MSVRNILMAAGGSADDKLYVDDVFSAYTYTGNGGTQTINNGIDLAGEGGMVWVKSRSVLQNHLLVDTIRGASKSLASDSTSADNTIGNGIGTDGTFNSTGFTLGSGTAVYGNQNTSTYVSWTFRKAPKFFDVVTYTGNGAASRSIAHSLGIAPGMIIVKRTDTTANWVVWHRSLSTDTALLLQETLAAFGVSAGTFSSVGASSFSVGHPSSQPLNESGAPYVAYLFAHDAGADGIVQCGSYVGNGTDVGPSVTLGWEPQYVLVKSATGATNWEVLDASRGMSVGGAPAFLRPNLSDAETTNGWTSAVLEPTANGFRLRQGSTSTNNNGSTYIYLAIRRPNKPPTTGTQVYNAVARTGTGAAATVTGVGFAPDAVIGMARSVGGATYSMFVDRLRGASKYLQGGATSAEVNDAANSVTSFGVDGFSIENGASFSWPNQSPYTYINWVFRRAPGFFDVVCRSGTGASAFTRIDVNHSLGAVPELIIYKCRSNTSGWHVGTFSPSNPTQEGYGLLNQTYEISSATLPGNFLYAAPTTTQFSFWEPGFDLDVSGRTYVAYLFASLPGISKVGSYTGNGTTQTINCGFTTGARFILIKRTDSTGDWYVWDTVRGIISANDPHLSLNTSASEVTTNDSIDPDASGFIVNQVAATNINVSGGTYIFLAIA